MFFSGERPTRKHSVFDRFFNRFSLKFERLNIEFDMVFIDRNACRPFSQNLVLASFFDLFLSSKRAKQASKIVKKQYPEQGIFFDRFFDDFWAEMGAKGAIKPG